MCILECISCKKLSTLFNCSCDEIITETGFNCFQCRRNKDLLKGE